MSQYANHPIVQALNVIAPLIAPSFELVSAADDNRQIYKNPILAYVIPNFTNKVLDRSTGRFRTTFSFVLELAVFECKSPEDWCKYSELEGAQDRQSLFYKLEVMIQNIITMFVDPNKINPSISNGDTVYSQYGFALEGFRDGVYLREKSKQNMTSTAIFINMSCFTGDGEICCVDDGTKEIAEKIQGILVEGSVSYRTLQKRIDE